MEIRGISKTFATRGGQVAALGRCDLAVGKGEFVTVVGPSGCGKSTLMMIAAGLDAPSTGEILVDGTPAGPAGPRRTVVFQRFALFPSETVAENIEFGLRVAGLRRAESERARRRAARADGPRALPRRLPARAVRRHAAARRDRACAGRAARRSCSWTSRSARSTRRRAPCCRKRCRGCSASCTTRCSSSRTASRRPSTSATASW